MNLRNDLRTARRTSREEWRLLVEAAGSLMVARLAVWLVPFRRLAARLGDAMAESSEAVSEEQRVAAAQIGWAVRTLGRRLPWMSQCLVQAAAVTWMLQRRDIPSTLYFGLARDTDGGLKAHAWVRAGAKVLTGARERQDFRVVATFAAPLLAPGSNFAPPPIMTSSGETQPEEGD